MMKDSVVVDLAPLSQDLKNKQKTVKNIGFVSLGTLILIPISIHFLNRFQVELWKISLVVVALGLLAVFLHRFQQNLKREIETACYKLGVGVRLVKKYRKASFTDQYQIFQEGHRYYYLENTATGEKRLVAKEKVLQDFDLAF